MCFKFLGVLVNDTLTWSDRIDMVCNKVTCSLNLLHCLSWFLLQHLLLLYLKSYILPLTTVMLFGLDALKIKLFAWKLC